MVQYGHLIGSEVGPVDHILIVEDDRALSQGIRLALDQAGRQFTQCHTLR